LVEANLSKLEIFSKRLSFLVGNENLGVVKSGKFITHGKISINENSCTLCLSCAGACNTGALFADANDNSLKYNASLCTACGYCVKSCAEKDTINLQIGQIELKPEYFSHQILAKDSLFACIECGKEFAPSKAVMKIAEMMMSKISDPVTQKTLYCCGDCKAKIMIQKMHEQKDI
ncbi:MAG: ferredoxin, partial [Campylobacter sp.]|nr:ferredoxin [Campylobacter sp.]